MDERTNSQEQAQDLSEILRVRREKLSTPVQNTRRAFG